MERETILSIWAHPDDETYLAGGIMAAAAERGARVVCVTATAGERGTDDPDAWPPARLGAVRRLEAAAAMAVLGVREHRVLGLPDGGLAALDDAGIALAGSLLDELWPDTILTFGPDGVTFHPDHIAIHRWVTEAWHQRGCPGRLLYASTTDAHQRSFRSLYERWGIYMTEERPAGVAAEELALRLRLTGRDLDRKLVALRAMATQTGPAMAAIDEETYARLVDEECFVAAAPHRSVTRLHASRVA